ncbi:MAG TPA: hypothetical protein DEA52_03295 [Clostridiaceae bacterium]|nr:hypothetical protein [Clostridiaceae bacterium]
MKKLVLFGMKYMGKFLQTRGKGTSLPGYLALKCYPNLLSDFHYPERSILVTGTNGKTTVSNLLSGSLGEGVVNNKDGANMKSGLATTLLMHAKGQKIPGSSLVLEVDEANLLLIKEAVTPKYLVITNLFEDQSDRYGGIVNLVERLKKSIQEETTLVLNGNDPHVVMLGEALKNKKVYYGVSVGDEVEHIAICPRCQGHLIYEKALYGTLGTFHCSGCHLKTPKLAYAVESMNSKKGTFDLLGVTYTMVEETLYSLFNMLPVIALSLEEGMTPDFSTYEKIPGRLEPLKGPEAKGFLNLVKNQVGLEETLRHIRNHAKGSPHEILYALSNTPADGQDMSWVQKVDFQGLFSPQLKKFIATGPQRAYLRDVLVEKGLGHLVEQVEDVENYPGDRRALYVLVSYSEMAKGRETFIQKP